MATLPARTIQLRHTGTLASPSTDRRPPRTGRRTPATFIQVRFSIEHSKNGNLRWLIASTHRRHGQDKTVLSCLVRVVPVLLYVPPQHVVWRLRGDIIRTALCWIVWHNVHSQHNTYVSSSYRSNRLGLSHWDPYTVHRGSCLELYYCNMVEWFWWDSGLTLTINCFDTVGLVIWPVKSSPKWPMSSGTLNPTHSLTQLSVSAPSIQPGSCKHVRYTFQKFVLLLFSMELELIEKCKTD